LILRAADVFLSPVNQARWARFRHNRRGYWSLWLFILLFVQPVRRADCQRSPLLVQYRGQLYVPVLKTTAKRPLAAVCHRRRLSGSVAAAAAGDHGWALWAPVRFGATTLTLPPDALPFPPSASNWLGTDANGGDVLARIFYGTRISILFGLLLTCSPACWGAGGRHSGYYGGKIDLWGQRLLKSGQACQRCS
jgi:microcin C transport system permease protein